MRHSASVLDINQPVNMFQKFAFTIRAQYPQINTTGMLEISQADQHYSGLFYKGS